MSIFTKSRNSFQLWTDIWKQYKKSPLKNITISAQLLIAIKVQNVVRLAMYNFICDQTA